MIAIITYDAPHRKTQDVITKLMLNGYSDLHMVVVPWVERKSFRPIYRHRPSASVNISIEDLARNFKIDFSRVETNFLDNFFSGHSFDHILIAGAGLLPVRHKIINAHPGFLPNVKGLDAFKWAVYLGQPIGVTTHYISDKTDEGKMIERRVVPVYFEDTFHSVAYRIYETEVEMLVNAISMIDNNLPDYQSLQDTRYVANRRMPHNLELIMMERFEELRKRSGSVIPLLPHQSPSGDSGRLH